MTGIFGALRKALSAGRGGGRTAVARPEPVRRQPNLFEAAAVFVAASAEDDEERMDEASGWVSPEQLSFGVGELACRALIALARERGESPQTVARDLLGVTADR
ncbi:hypothetical protein [Streptomyces sp. NBC_00525]|uniref:hypothetical protein n=1 Tax=Streptomyces sp. NBC_00525 TaxID=2903660 RepID=UPI002E818BB2|nr:hypothetical protein [Streptomyces sp. NBC_00525]WUC97436.1 hypothetical protein OG710_29155 [Streptomyces sp. NBC_00525]